MLILTQSLAALQSCGYPGRGLRPGLVQPRTFDAHDLPGFTSSFKGLRLKQLIVNADDFGFIAGVTQGMAVCGRKHRFPRLLLWRAMQTACGRLRPGPAQSPAASASIFNSPMESQCRRGPGEVAFAGKGQAPESVCDAQETSSTKGFFCWNRINKSIVPATTVLRRRILTPTTKKSVHRLSAVFEDLSRDLRDSTFPPNQRVCNDLQAAQGRHSMRRLLPSELVKDESGIGSFMRLVRSDFHRLATTATAGNDVPSRPCR